MTENQSHPFDAVTHLNGGPDIYTGQTSSLYSNMVGPFGVAIAAAILNSVMIHPDCLGDPMTLTVNFAAPVKDGSFDIVPKPIRTNRSTQHWFITLSQENEMAVTAMIVTAKRHETWSSTEITMPDVPSADQVAPIPDVQFPVWLGQYNIRPIQGSMPPFFDINGEEPFQAAKSMHWIRDEQTRSIDFLSLAAMADSFFPRILVRRKEFVPAGTVSFTVYFHVSAEELTAVGDSPVLGVAHANKFNQNYFDQTGEVWSKNGILLATTSQMAYFKK